MGILKSTQPTRNDLIKMALQNFAVEAFDELFKPISYRHAKRALKEGKKIVASSEGNLQVMTALGMHNEPFIPEANIPYMMVVCQSNGKSWKSSRKIYSLIRYWYFSKNYKYWVID